MSVPRSGHRHLGVDLAWGTRRPTGVAVLDEGGRLLEVASVRTDEEILALLSPYAEGPCTVALDAPLVVTNPTGNRLCEQQLNVDFRAFHAGAHPTNTGRAEFAEGSRGGRLAEALGLDLDPGLDRDAGQRRRALEVYPHAATIALFGLPRTLKYKQKPGRDLELLRRELLTLMALVKDLGTADPPLHLGGSGWDDLQRAVEQATRKADLRRVEDQVDAVVCAYVALFARHRPEAMTAYGDLGSGLICTPTLPEGLEPTPRSVAEVEQTAQPDGDPLAAVPEYAVLHPRLLAAEPVFAERVRGVLDDAGINYLSVTSRAKTVASFAEKARRLDADGELLHPDPLGQITDKIGLRVITYVHADVAAVAELLRDEVEVIEDRDWGRETASEGRFGYASRHLIVSLDDERTSGFVAQVQIRTVLQHAWAEFEHDIRYKGTVPPEHARDFDRRFTLAAGLLELADQEFATIRATLRAVPQPTGETRPGGIEPRDLAAFLAGQYDDSGWSRPDHYDWITGLVAGLGIDSLAGLAETLRGVDEGMVALRMDYRYPPGAVRRLDDALLLAHGEDYVALPGNAHRVDLLRARLARLHGEG